MSQLQDEIDANQAKFFTDWTDAHSANVAALKGNPAYVQSYRRLTVLQALRIHIITPNYSPKSAAFFHEAHNDALVSHVAASTGAWRLALKSLRSCIENVLCSFYYSEHPVELELWEKGKFIIGFTELLNYAAKHPRISGHDQKATGVEILRSEYATLSKAVHASSSNFRMTDTASNVMLWDPDPNKVSQWSTRERKTIEGISLLMASRHSDLLAGTKLTPLRNTMSFGISATGKTALKPLGIIVT